MKILHISVCVLLFLLPPTEERSTRFKKEARLTFQRDAVEGYPTLDPTDRSAPYRGVSEFGTRSLPLRAAIENVPDLIKDSRRVPLRDAVEQRPAPDEAAEEPEEFDLSTNFDLFYSANSPLRRTIYSPLSYFREAIFQPAQTPFRIDNHSQQLLANPFRAARSYKHSEVVETVSPKSDERVVCYLQAAAIYRKEPMAFTPDELDPFACTHVIYAFANIDPHTYTMISNDDEYDVIQGGYRSVTGLKRLNPKLKVLISVGEVREDRSRRFSSMVASASRRRDFIRSAIYLIKKYDFDGLDIHWQYPGAEELGGTLSDKQYLDVFLEEISEVFKAQGWLLTIAVPASRFRAEDGFIPQNLANVVDFVNLQAYDFHREREPIADHHANLYPRAHDNGLDLFLSVDYAVKFWLKKGLPRNQIVLGIPFFGRSFTLQYTNETRPGMPIKGPGHEGFYTQTPGFLAYFEICDLVVNEGWKRSTDASGSPYIVNGDQWVGYDDPASVEQKIRYVQDMKLGGVSIWASDLDDFKGVCGKKWPLLTTINRHLQGNELLPMKQSKGTPTKPFGTCRAEGLFSDPNNCAAYYICRSGLSYHLSCGDNMMFDPSTGQCEFTRGEKCKPGQSFHLPNVLKRIDYMLTKEPLKSANPKVVCYITNWAFYRKAEGKFVPEHLDQRLCTHVVYAFASLDPEKLLLKSFDPWADYDNNLYVRVTSIPDTKVLLSLGGWTDSAGDKYSRLVGDGSARRRFVVGAVSFLRKHNFGGLHLDWNYPVCWQSNCKKGASSDKPNFTKLVQELQQEFDKQNPPLILAVAISGYKEVIDVAYDLPGIGASVDFMSVMTYDYHGAWERQTGHVSPLYSGPKDTYPQYNSNYTIEYLVGKGAPREKLLLGVPFYGQSFTLPNTNNHGVGAPSAGSGEPGEYTKQPGMLAYHEICNRVYNKRWIVNRDASAGPYAYYGDQWVGFEDIKSVRDKAEYIKSKGLGGAVAWTIDLDDFSNRCCGGSFPLLKSLNRGLGRIPDVPSREDCTKPPEPVTPAPPQTTTGVDTGAEHTTEHEHWEKPSKPTTATSWWTEKPTAATKPTSTGAWWTEKPSSTTKPTTTGAWWTEKPSSTTKPTTTSPWWTEKPTTPSTASTWWSQSTSTTQSTTWASTTQTTTRPWWVTQSTTTIKPSTVPPWGGDPSTIIPPPAVVMPEVEKPAIPCQPGQYVPDHTNCNAFYRCVAGELAKQYCAAGLHWNKNAQVCDWPDKAKCDGSTTDTSMSWQQPSTHRPTTVNHWQTHTQPATTTLAPVPIREEKCNVGQYYPHEECSHFYVCVNGHLIPQPCPPGLYYSTGSNMCDWKFKVSCMGRREMGKHFHEKDKISSNQPQLYSACAQNTFAPYPGDCNKYLHCLFDKYHEFNCAPGLHWNHEARNCDWPENSKCDGTSSVGTGDIEVPNPSSEAPSSTTEWQPPSTTGWNPPSTTTGWNPPATTTAVPDWQAEWHPPIPPTSEQPPLSEPLKPQSGYFKVVCYFTNWAWYRKGLGRYLPEDIDPNLCTHIVYGFAVLDFEGLVLKAHDSWADYDNQFYKRVTDFKKQGVKVTVALGGWNDSQGDKYSRLVNNPAARARFIQHAIEFIEKWNFDGLDLDWEYPKCWQVDCKKGPDSDKPAFAAWVREIKAAFKPRGLLLSAAVSPSKTVIDAGYDVPTIAENLDWVAVMTYDFHGQWDKQTGHVAPLYYHDEDAVSFYNANYSINYWISEGVPRRKIVMGMPLYGQSFRLEKEASNGLNAKAPGPGEAGEHTRAAGFLAYYEICHNIKSGGWKVIQDPQRRMGPYAYKGDQWVSYDDRAMIKLKSEFIRKMDLGGGMIWALDLDDFKNRCGEGRHPLLTTIRNVLADAGTGQPEAIAPPAPGPQEAVVEEEVVPPPRIDAPSVEPPSTGTEVSLVNKNSDFKVVCYFTNWAWYRQGTGKYLPSDIDPDLCTHIVYGFAVLNGDQLIIKPHDTWADFDNKFYEKVTALKAKGIKVLVAIGGWNDSAGDKYSRLVNNPSARRRFIAHVVDFIEGNNFDGLDLDWEYPKCWQVDCNKGPASDKPAFAEFVKELHMAFQPKGWLLSAAVSPSRRVVDAGYDVPTLSRYLDWIAVMCYDYHGQWDKITGHVAPMYAHPEDVDATFNTNFTIHYWIEQGAERKKLVLGMPMYGQSFSLADNNLNGLNAPTYGGGEAGEETRARGFLAYYEICTNVINKGWSVTRDRKGHIGPYAHLRDQWVSFDDIGMIRHKSEYVKAMGLGGGMIWALDLDDFRNLCGCEEYPLLRTINRVLRDYAKPDPRCVLGKSPKPDQPQKPEPEPTTQKPVVLPPYEPQEPVLPGEAKPCVGRLFVAHEQNCNEYYLCNQGQLQLQVCPSGLYWNKDHCDWPENTECHHDGTTTSTTSSPPTPSNEVIDEIEEPVVHPRPPTGTQVEGAYKVICYFTNWAWYRQGDGKYLPSDIDANLCTHINYGFAVLDSTTLTLKPHDSWADIDNEFYKKVISYKSKGIKVLIALGGWNDSAGNKYSLLVNDPQARARFVAHILDFIQKWDFDGLDLDWEYPKCWQVDCNKGPDSDKQGFADLVRELSEAFKPKGLLLSAAVSPSKAVIDAGYDVPTLSRYMDWIAVMTYDFHGHWDKQTGHVAPLHYYPGDAYDYFNSNFTLNYWIEKGASPSKIIMGMPLYGQSFTLADTGDRGLNAKSNGPGEAGEFTRAGGFLAFYEICERVKKQQWVVTRDSKGRIGPYAYAGNQWVSYDDIVEIKRKSHLIKELGLGGGMVWALDLDDFRNRCGCGKHPLLKTLNNELRGTASDITVTNCT